MSIGTALNNFTQSVAGIFYSLLNAVLAIFHAVLALGNELLTSVFKLFQAVAALVKDLVQGTVGFVFGESRRRTVQVFVLIPA